MRPAQPLWYKLTQYLRAQHRQGAVGFGIEDLRSGPCPVTYQPWDLGQEISYVPVLFLMIHFRLSTKIEFSIYQNTNISSTWPGTEYVVDAVKRPTPLPTLPVLLPEAAPALEFGV